MTRKTLLPAIFFSLCLPLAGFAQLKQDTETDFSRVLVKPNKMESMVGLLGLDPNRFSMSHSYTFSIGSFGGESFSQGLYLNTMKYQLSNPITMYLQLGFQHQPIAGLRQDGLDQNQIFVSGAGFEYKPSDSFQLNMEFSQQPNAYYNSLYSPYGRFHSRRSLLLDETKGNN